MKTRLELAHDYLRDIISNWDFDDNFDPIAQAYEYADAMLAENEKGEQEARKKKRAEMRELLNANNTFVEKEGQHFYDVEWQPDWGQAPSDALTWAINGKGDATWALYENGEFYSCVEAPSFNYQGDWRDSLRKRPV